MQVFFSSRSHFHINIFFVRYNTVFPVNASEIRENFSKHMHRFFFPLCCNNEINVILEINKIESNYFAANWKENILSAIISKIYYHSLKTNKKPIFFLGKKRYGKDLTSWWNEDLRGFLYKRMNYGILIWIFYLNHWNAKNFLVNKILRQGKHFKRIDSRMI